VNYNSLGNRRRLYALSRYFAGLIADDAEFWGKWTHLVRRVGTLALALRILATLKA